MRSAFRALLGVLAFVSVAGGAAPAEAQYTYTKIMVPNSTWTEASGINDLGQVVGTYTDVNGVAHGFLYHNGVYSDVDFPNMAHNYAFGIRDDGAIVGSFSPVMPRGPYSASLLENGVWSAYDFPGHETDGRAINSSGHIVGIYYAGPGSPDHGFLKVGDTYTSIDYPGASITYAFGLNDAGYITGTYRDLFGGIKGFVYFGGVYSTVTYPGATQTIVTQINNANTMVGWKVEAGKTTGYTLVNGKFRPVVVPFANATTTRARGINDLGAVVGTYSAPDCPVACSFLATPAPAATPLCDSSVGLSYANGTLNTQWTIRTNGPAVWTTYLVVQGVPYQIWSLPVPAINPAANVDIPFPLPPVGSVLLASFIGTSAHGTLCVDFASLNTGP